MPGRGKVQDGRGGRKAVSVQEIKASDSYHNAFRWEPKTDYFNPQLEDSEMLERISNQTGRSMDEIIEEYEKRKIIVNWLVQRGIRSYDKVAEIIGKYYRDPESLMKKIEYGV